MYQEYHVFIAKNAYYSNFKILILEMSDHVESITLKYI